MAAFYFSPALDEARARWGVAQGGVITAGARPNPSIAGALGYNTTTPADEITPWIPEVMLDLPLETAGKRGIRIAEARQRSESARLSLLTAAWEVRTRTRQAFLDLYVARQTDSLLARRLEIQTETARILDAQRQAGEASPTEATRAHVDLAASRIEALDAERSAAAARSELSDAVGVPPAALDEVGLDFEELGVVEIEIPATEVRRRALLGRSDLLGALADYEASQAALQLEVRKQYPDIGLGPGYQLDQTDAKWTLGLIVSLPFFDRNRGPIAEAAARREAAAAHFLAVQSRVLSEVERSVVSAGSAVAQVEAADTLLETLSRREDRAQAAYSVGEISRLDLLGLQTDMISTALTRLHALDAAQQALGSLEDAMQSPLDVEAWVLDPPRGIEPPDGTQDGGGP